MDLLIASLADRPDLPGAYAEGEDLWPPFMYQDAVIRTRTFPSTAGTE